MIIFEKGDGKMKKLSKIIASVFMLAVVVISGAMLVGCGEKDFDKDIAISNPYGQSFVSIK